MKLDQYEKEIEEALESGKFKSVKNLEQEIAVAKQMADNHVRKDQRMPRRGSFVSSGLCVNTTRTS